MRCGKLLRKSLFEYAASLTILVILRYQQVAQKCNSFLAKGRNVFAESDFKGGGGVDAVEI